MIGLSGTKASAYKVSTFVDTSVWFAAAAKGDRNNELAKSILQSVPDHVTTDHVLIETWLLLKSQFGRGPAEAFWERIRSSSVHIEPVTPVMQCEPERPGRPRGHFPSSRSAVSAPVAVSGGHAAMKLRLRLRR
jgi:hypothetical protein